MCSQTAILAHEMICVLMYVNISIMCVDSLSRSLACVYDKEEFNNWFENGNDQPITEFGNGEEYRLLKWILKVNTIFLTQRLER